MRYCMQCGAQVSESAKFCEQCGVKLTEIPPVKPSDEHREAKITNIDSTADHKSAKEQKEKNNDTEIEELDLTALDKKVTAQKTSNTEHSATEPSTVKEDEKQNHEPPKRDNIININDILESEKKVEMDNSIKREVLADDEVFSKICPMCGEDMQINKQLLEKTPVMIKCLKCGNETKVW